MHAHHHHDHQHAAQVPRNQQLLLRALFIVFGFALIEIVFGLYAHSLTLLSDAGHMIADGLSLGLSALAAWIAAKPPSAKHTYGLGRAEVIGAWLSSLFIIGTAIAIFIEASHRLDTHHPVKGGIVVIVASLGFLANIVMAWLLGRGEKTLNMRAALIHVMGDLLGSIAAIASGAIIYFTGFMPIDAILSIFIALLILFSSLQLLRESLLVLMEGVPPHLSLKTVQQQLQALPQVCGVQDLHIWTLSSGMTVLTAHIRIQTLEHWPGVFTAICLLLKKNFAIEHVTLQPDVTDTTLTEPLRKPCN